MSIHELEVQTIDGQPMKLAEFRGRVMAIVNVASECGYTPQYAGLQKLWETYHDDGLVVLGFPSNDFGHQEPGTEHQIEKFVDSIYGVDFPMFAKISVVGEDCHPLYRYLSEATGEEPTWNFNKYLVDRDGRPTDHFSHQVEPMSDTLTERIETLLTEL